MAYENPLGFPTKTTAFGWRWSILYKFLLRPKPGSLGPMLIPQETSGTNWDLLGMTLECGKMNNLTLGKKIGYHTNQMIHAVAFLGWLYKRDLLERLLLVTSNLWGIKKVTAWEWENFLVGDFYGTFKPSPFKGSNTKKKRNAMGFLGVDLRISSEKDGGCHEWLTMLSSKLQFILLRVWSQFWIPGQMFAGFLRRWFEIICNRTGVND